MGRSNGVVGRPVALQERWNRGDLALPTLTPGSDSDMIGPDFTFAARATVTTAGTAHDKGAWAELIASTGDAYDGLVLSCDSTFAGSVDSARLLDVGIGAAASEVVIVPELDVGGWLLAQSQHIILPVHIPKGSRVALRCQGVQISDADVIYFGGYLRAENGRRSPSSLVAMGTSTSTSTGTTLTTPGAANTKGAWTQITASTPQAFRAILVQVTLAAGTTTIPASNLKVDVAVGASGTESVIVANMNMRSSTIEAISDGVPQTTVPVHIPAGSRLAMRYQAQDTSVPLAGSIIGVPY